MTATKSSVSGKAANTPVRAFACETKRPRLAVAALQLLRFWVRSCRPWRCSKVGSYERYTDREADIAQRLLRHKDALRRVLDRPEISPQHQRFRKRHPLLRDETGNLCGTMANLSCSTTLGGLSSMNCHFGRRRRTYVLRCYRFSRLTTTSGTSAPGVTIDTDWWLPRVVMVMLDVTRGAQATA